MGVEWPVELKRRSLAVVVAVGCGSTGLNTIKSTFSRLMRKAPKDQASKSGFSSGMSDKYRHVVGHFEPTESQFVLLHMKERLHTIEVNLAACGRRLVVPFTSLVVGGGAMISPLVMDYVRLNRLEHEVNSLRVTVAKAKVKSHAMDIALHGA